MERHLVTHPAQIEVMRPEHLVVLKGFASRLYGLEPLAHQSRRRALLPLEHILKAQTSAPLALFREVAKRFRTINPEHPPFIIHEMAPLTMSDPDHDHQPTLLCW